jgi:phosphatidylethanolamine/phosphatidyl-N-methylethanolamine N-methyltransferase
MVRSTIQFLREFAKDRRVIGAVAPSSVFLARAIVQGMGIESSKVVLEYGPGTGSFTREILARLGPHSKFVAIEINPTMARLFRSRFPKVHLVHGSAETLPEVLREIGEAKVDCVVSGLPWAAFSADMQDRLLAATHECLREGGKFVTFAYVHGLLLPQGKRLRRVLCERFRRVSRSPVELRNVPPAFVYRCIK